MYKPYGTEKRHIQKIAGLFSVLFYFLHELRELFEVKGLGAVRECMSGVVVDFDDKAVRADRDSGFGEGNDKFPPAGSVAGVDDNWQVAEFFD
jgi:hypothetical protein